MKVRRDEYDPEQLKYVRIAEYPNAVVSQLGHSQFSVGDRFYLRVYSETEIGDDGEPECTHTFDMEGGDVWIGGAVNDYVEGFVQPGWKIAPGDPEVMSKNYTRERWWLVRKDDE